MPMTISNLATRLARAPVMLLDGGVSTEIQRRGIALDANVWSGLTTKTHPHVVQQVHEDYIRAGAEVITANTYSTARHVLESLMLGHEARLLNFKSVQLAKQARERAATREVWIAGSMSSMPPLQSDQEVAVGPHIRASYQEQAEGLAEAGVDLIMAEMMRDAENAAMVIEAATATGLPVWVGFSTMLADDGGEGDKEGVENVRSLRWKNRDHTTAPIDFATLLTALNPLLTPRPGQAAGIMHTPVAGITPALAVLQQHWAGPCFAYAETGQFIPPDWHFEAACTPTDYAEQAAQWIATHGLKIVGGCCGTAPEHIRALKDKLVHGG